MRFGAAGVLFIRPNNPPRNSWAPRLALRAAAVLSSFVDVRIGVWLGFLAMLSQFVFVLKIKIK